VLDQRPQPFGQRLAADLQLALERVEPGGATRDVAHDQQRPPVADDAERLRDRARGAGELLVRGGGQPDGHGGHGRGPATGRG
jgi:hypothetical protein